MFQIRIHGRGGQGVVTAAEMLSVAAFMEGYSAQAFPSFGSERMGAPVMAFCRIDEKEIRLREPIADPDALIIQDPTLLQQKSVFEGLAPKGYLLINSTRGLEELGIDAILKRLPAGHARVVPATDLAMKHVGRPVPNAALLGGFCAVTGRIKLASVEAAIMHKFPGEVGKKNVEAARTAYQLAGGVLVGEGVAQHA
jgi:pyruvate ferredoxin oxidoreductase gamma subunit